MNKIIVATLLLAAATTLQAEEIAYVSDGSTPGEVCVAALNSPAAARRKAAEAGLDRQDLRNLVCNGIPLQQFTERQLKPASGPARYAIQAGDASPETELCVAALKSKAEFDKVKQRHFEQAKTVEAELRCNRQPLEAFVSKYRNRSLNASL